MQNINHRKGFKSNSKFRLFGERVSYLMCIYKMLTIVVIFYYRGGTDKDLWVETLFILINWSLGAAVLILVYFYIVFPPISYFFLHHFPFRGPIRIRHLKKNLKTNNLQCNCICECSPWCGFWCQAWLFSKSTRHKSTAQADCTSTPQWWSSDLKQVQMNTYKADFRCFRNSTD